MPVSVQDLATARSVAARIVAAGQGRVSRVVMIGSRARGVPRPDSDLDLVVLVEIPRTERPWSPPQNTAERAHLLRELGPSPLPVDLWVRTTDRYAEAHAVVGGVEWLASTEGVVVHSRPFGRAPLVRRSHDEVRRQNVSAWVEHALLAVDEAVRTSRESTLQSAGHKHGAAAARVALERGVNALLVSHGIAADQRLGAAGMISRFAEVDAAAAAWLNTVFSPDPSAVDAVRFLRAVVRLLQRDPSLVPFVRGPEERLSRPLLVL